MKLNFNIKQKGIVSVGVGGCVSACVCVCVCACVCVCVWAGPHYSHTLPHKQHHCIRSKILCIHTFDYETKETKSVSVCVRACFHWTRLYSQTLPRWQHSSSTSPNIFCAYTNQLPSAKRTRNLSVSKVNMLHTYSNKNNNCNNHQKH